jgi:hypothetical protein
VGITSSISWTTHWALHLFQTTLGREEKVARSVCLSCTVSSTVLVHTVKRGQGLTEEIEESVRSL